MTEVNLKELSVEELRKLAKDAEKQIKVKQEEDRKRVFKEMQVLAASIGMTIEDVIQTQPKRRGRKPKVRKEEV